MAFEAWTMTAAGLGIGFAFGAVAERTRFSPYDAVRETVAGEAPRALPVVLAAMAAAVLFTQAALALHLFALEGTTYLPPRQSMLAVFVGGLVFGVGAVAARGCLTRCTIRAATGDGAAMLAVGIGGLAAYATVFGLFAPIRNGLHRVLPSEFPAVDLAHRFAETLALPVDGVRVAVAIMAALAVVAVLVNATGRLRVAGGVVLGALVAVAWVATGTVFADPFEPPRPQAVAIAGPLSQLTHAIIDTARCKFDYVFGIGAGIVGGAALSALLAGRFEPRAGGGLADLRDAAIGGGLMGFAAVVCGGCTIGQGLSGLSVLTVMAPITIAGIVVGIVATLVARGLMMRRRAARGLDTGLPVPHLRQG